MADIDDYTLPSSAPDPPGESRAADVSLPANIQAELVILGAALLDAKFLDEAAELIEDTDFFLDSHQRIFRCMLALRDANRPIDLVTLSEELSRTKELEAVGGSAFIASLTENLPRRPVIADYVRSVKDKALMRRLMSICSAAIARAADQSETALEVISAAEGQLLDIAQEASTQRLRTVYESVELAGGLEPYMKPILNPDTKPGLLTGFYDLDRLTGGFKKGELILIAARPSQGKSALCLNLAENICVGSEAVAAIFSLEMSRTSLERRLLAGIARVDVRRATMGEFVSNTEREKLTRAMNALVTANIYIDDTPSLTVMQVKAKARRLKQKMGRLDILLCDYLQMLRGSGRFQTRQEEVGSISRGLKALAKDLDLPVVALSQVARSSEQRQDKRPTLADLRESGAQEADADNVFFIHRPEYFNREDESLKGIAELLCAKNRDGPTDVVRLAYIAEFTRFENLAIR